MKENTKSVTGEGNAPRKHQFTFTDEHGDYQVSVPEVEAVSAPPQRDTPSFSFITSDRAWKLAEASGKLAPYAGYMIELNDGRKLRCRRDAHKTVFEISQ